MPCKDKRLYPLTSQASRYRLLALQSGAMLSLIRSIRARRVGAKKSPLILPLLKMSVRPAPHQDFVSITSHNVRRPMSRPTPLRKAGRKYMLTCKVCRYCPLSLEGSTGTERVKKLGPSVAGSGTEWSNIHAWDYFASVTVRLQHAIDSSTLAAPDGAVSARSAAGTL